MTDRIRDGIQVAIKTITTIGTTIGVLALNWFCCKKMSLSTMSRV